MRIVVNLDAEVSDMFNEVRGAASIGAFAALCVKAHLQFLKGKSNAKEIEPIRAIEVHTRAR